MERSVTCRGDRSFSFAPRTTALMVIDMQKDFLAPEGMAGVGGEDLRPLRAIVPRIQAMLGAARKAGLAVVHTREGFAPDLSDVSRLRAERGSVGRQGPLGRFLIRGEPGQDFIDELPPDEGEAVFDKPGFGAFYKTGLEEHLRARGISHLILTGVTTQCCVQSSLREAVDRGFYCLLVEDCCAAFDERLHQATLDTIQGEGHLFGWITDLARLIPALGSADEPAGA